MCDGGGGGVDKFVGSLWDIYIYMYIYACVVHWYVSLMILDPSLNICVHKCIIHMHAYAYSNHSTLSLIVR